MNTGKKYHTRQKELILECMKEHARTYLTIHEIEDIIKAKEQKIGLTTIYRNLDKLTDERKLIKASIEGYSGNCYRYIPEEERNLFSLKCEDCGSVVNIKCPELAYLCSHVVEEHHVKINPVKTMFYGKCEDCSQE